LRTYPIYTVIAEKLHAIALLGMTNSRVLKDYFDLWVLLDRETLDMNTLAQGDLGNIRRGAAWRSPRTCRWGFPMNLQPIRRDKPNGQRS
jgi:hypothetical protein